MGEALTVRPRTGADDGWVRHVLVAAWGAVEVARLGELVDASALPGLVAEQDGERLGLALVADRDGDCEVVSLTVERPGGGVGTALLRACIADARARGCRRLWLTTTNDNTRALRLYQRCGLHLRTLHHGGVAASRRVKPGIPSHGADGIPLEHELELELRLR